MNVCPKCQSDKIIPQAKVLNRTENMFNFEVGVYENPDAFIFKNRVTSPVYAKVCGECGYIEFYAAYRHDLYQAFLKSKDKDEQY